MKILLSLGERWRSAVIKCHVMMYTNKSTAVLLDKRKQKKSSFKICEKSIPFQCNSFKRMDNGVFILINLRFYTVKFLTTLFRMKKDTNDGA